MSSIACLVLFALLGALCSGSVVKRESPPEEPRFRSCLINGNVYPHRAPTGDDCGRCRCINGRQHCNRMACIVDGKEISVPREGNNVSK